MARALAGLDDVDGAIELAGDVWEGIERCDARGLPYPIESIADCASAVPAADPRFERMIQLGHRVARGVLSELTDLDLRATFLELVDVRFVCR
jgi:hypothetical protein